MNLLSSVSVIVIPRWARVIIITILALLSVICISISILGAYDSNRPGWIEAGASILAIILPFIIIGIIVGFGHSGVEALVGRNSDYLERNIPALMVLLGDPRDAFRKPGNDSKATASELPDVVIQHSPNHSIANYIVTISPEFSEGLDGYPKARQLAFRIELNAMKANINILIPAEQSAGDPAAIFPHTIGGATKEGYWFSPDMIERTWNGQDYDAIVGVKRLDEDFLTNPIKRLDFGQDLMFMLRSMLQERPDLFTMASDS